MKIFFTILFISLIFFTALLAQNILISDSYISPLKIPLSFSGSFGEIRPTHFHSGLDFRTQGRTGIPVYAVKEGYVSRISVSSTGYGKALYLTHPDGKTTVYGHLEKFNPDVERYVKDRQYYTENFNINVTLPAGEFEYSQGDIIAWSGNSGSSGGPHLHFEVRNTKSEWAQNPLFYIPGIKDNSAPNILGLYVYPLSENGHVSRTTGKKRFPTIQNQRSYSLQNNPVIEVYGRIGFGIQANDLFNGTGMTCGIYSAKVLLDGKPVFGFSMNQFSFDQTRYASSQLDYEEQITRNRKAHRLYRQPGNELEIYDPVENNGVLELADEKPHNIEIIVSDAFKNKSTLRFRIVSRKVPVSVVKFSSSKVFQYKKDNGIETEDVRIKIPRGALYDDFRFFYGTGTKPKGSYSKLHEVHDRTIPLHKPMTLSIKTEGLSEELKDKSLIVSYNKTNGKRSSVGGEYSNGWVTAQASEFGNYAVSVDTISPSILPLSIKEKKILSDGVGIKFKITDDLSGIKTFRGEIDDKWVLFEYDAKTKIISYTFDKTRMEFGKSHQLNLVVTDNKNNKSVYKATFFK